MFQIVYSRWLSWYSIEWRSSVREVPVSNPRRCKCPQLITKESIRTFRNISQCPCNTQALTSYFLKQCTGKWGYNLNDALKMCCHKIFFSSKVVILGYNILPIDYNWRRQSWYPSRLQLAGLADWVNFRIPFISVQNRFLQLYQTIKTKN